MTNNRKTNTKMFFSIGEVAKQLDEKVYNIRNWTKEFSVECTRKSSSTNRMYKKENIETLKTISSLKKQGKDTNSIKKYLKSKHSENIDVIQTLEEVKTQLVKIGKLL